MKDDSLSFFNYLPQIIIVCKGKEKNKNKNNCQTGFSNCFKNCFQISSRKLFYKTKKIKIYLNTPKVMIS